jgi:methenyltetrahydrofolate cyclohydrolase
MSITLDRYLKDLASPSPTPGGGSAAALAGSLSASLVAMVAGLSLNKGSLGKREAQSIRNKALTLQRRLSVAIREDSDAFDAVMESFRLPKESEKDSLHRRRAIQRAYRNAIRPPKRVCSDAIALLELSGALIENGNPNALSDAAMAFHLANAAFEGGLLNVRVNLASIRDLSFRRRLERWMKEVVKKRDGLIPEIMENLKRVYLTDAEKP